MRFAAIWNTQSGIDRRIRSVGTTPIPFLGARLFVYGGRRCIGADGRFDRNLKISASNRFRVGVETGRLAMRPSSPIIRSGKISSRLRRFFGQALYPRQATIRSSLFLLRSGPAISSSAFEKLRVGLWQPSIARRGVSRSRQAKLRARPPALANIVRSGPVMWRVIISTIFANGMIIPT